VSAVPSITPVGVVTEKASIQQAIVRLDTARCLTKLAPRAKAAKALWARMLMKMAHAV